MPEISLFALIKEKIIKYKQILLYLIFGGLSFLVNLSFFFLFNYCLSINELVANVLAWIITVIFVFITNKLWVFSSGKTDFSQTVKEFLLFIAGRIGTLVLEEALLFLLITVAGLNVMLVKIIAQIVVIVLNYIISRLIVFR